MSRSRTRRAGFTLAETLLASICVASVLGAGTAMVMAVSYSTAKAQSDATVSVQGNGVIGRVTRQIRSARLVGFHDSDEIVLWSTDTNTNDLMELSETGVLWTDTASKQLKWTVPFASTTAPAVLAANDRLVAFAEFEAGVFPTTVRASAYAATMIYSSDVTAFNVTANAAGTAADVVSISVSIQNGDSSSEFTSQATPRAPADYLATPGGSTDDGNAANRERRLETRSWNVP